jgi:hypothetical protein
MLSGATGRIYGAEIWPIAKGGELDWIRRSGSAQLHETSPCRGGWYDAIPDQTHTVVTGYDCLAGSYFPTVGPSPFRIAR